VKLAGWLADEVAAVELADERLREALLARYRAERIEPLPSWLLPAVIGLGLLLLIALLVLLLRRRRRRPAVALLPPSPQSSSSGVPTHPTGPPGESQTPTDLAVTPRCIPIRGHNARGARSANIPDRQIC
jgi:hypothetical protein